MFFKSKNNKNVDYYKIRVNNEFYFSIFKFNFSDLISEIVHSNGRIFSEEACGIGSLTKAVIEICPEIIASMSDINVNMVKLARENIGHIKMPIMVRDCRERHICDCKKDVIFSSNLLNILNFEDCEKTLIRQRIVANKVIHHISTTKCWYDTDGKQVVKDSKYWIERFSPKRHIVFNDDSDLIMIWEK